MNVFAPCLICSTRAFDRPLPQLLAVWRCGACGFVFSAGGRPDAQYEDDYFEQEGYRSYFGRAPQWRYEARVRLRWLLAAGRPAHLLEIGCAGGYFLAEARQEGIKASGIELSAIASRHASEELGVRVTRSAFEDAALGERVDALCAFHVLEHVDDPRRFLALARERLAAGGMLALEVPNIASARARRHGADWPGLQPWTHRWHFAPETLADLVSQSGFEVERVDTAFARIYRRPLERLSRGFAAHLVADLRSTRSMAATHRLLGDNVRLVGRAA